MLLCKYCIYPFKFYCFSRTTVAVIKATSYKDTYKNSECTFNVENEVFA